MDDEDGALEAIAELNGHDLHGRKMKVRYHFNALVKKQRGRDINLKHAIWFFLRPV